MLVSEFDDLAIFGLHCRRHYLTRLGGYSLRFVRSEGFYAGVVITCSRIELKDT